MNERKMGIARSMNEVDAKLVQISFEKRSRKTALAESHSVTKEE
jgi:hypothetical protein